MWAPADGRVGGGAQRVVVVGTPRRTVRGHVAGGGGGCLTCWSFAGPAAAAAAGLTDGTDDGGGDGSNGGDAGATGARVHLGVSTVVERCRRRRLGIFTNTRHLLRRALWKERAALVAAGVLDTGGVDVDDPAAWEGRLFPSSRDVRVWAPDGLGDALRFGLLDLDDVYCNAYLTAGVFYPVDTGAAAGGGADAAARAPARPDVRFVFSNATGYWSRVRGAAGPYHPPTMADLHGALGSGGAGFPSLPFRLDDPAYAATPPSADSRTAYVFTASAGLVTTAGGVAGSPRGGSVGGDLPAAPSPSPSPPSSASGSASATSAGRAEAATLLAALPANAASRIRFVRHRVNGRVGYVAAAADSVRLQRVDRLFDPASAPVAAIAYVVDVGFVSEAVSAATVATAVGGGDQGTDAAAAKAAGPATVVTEAHAAVSPVAFLADFLGLLSLFLDLSIYTLMTLVGAGWLALLSRGDAGRWKATGGAAAGGGGA